MTTIPEANRVPAKYKFISPEGRIYIALIANNCIDCAFERDISKCITAPSCMATVRDDHQSIIWDEVK